MTTIFWADASAQVAFGVVALAVVAYLAQREPPRVVLAAVLGGALLPLLAATFQGLSNLWGERPSLPFIGDLPAAKGLEVTRADEIFAGTEGVRLKGTFGDPNHFGTYMSLMTVIGVALRRTQWQGGEWRQAIAVGAVCIGAVSVIAASYSRTAWLALAVALGILLALVARAAAARTLGPVTPRRMLVVGLAGVLCLAPLAPRVVDRLYPATATTRDSNSTHAHTSEVALESLRDNPLFGIGQGDLGTKLGQGVRTSGAHSSYLTFGAELGLLGLITLVLAVVAGPSCQLSGLLARPCLELTAGYGCGRSWRCIAAFLWRTSLTTCGSTTSTGC